MVGKNEIERGQSEDGMLGDQVQGLLGATEHNQSKQVICCDCYLQRHESLNNPAHVICKSTTSVMDPLTSFDGGVSGGHVELFIFHNSPVKTLGGWPYTLTSHTQTGIQMHTKDLLLTPPAAI